MKDLEIYVKYGEKAIEALDKRDVISFFESIGVLEYLKYEGYACVLKANYFYRKQDYIKCLELLEENKNFFESNAKIEAYYWDYKIASMAQLHLFDEIRDIFFSEDVTMSCYSYSLAKYISLKNNFGNNPGIFRPDEVILGSNLKDDFFYCWFFQELYNDIASICKKNDELLLLKQAKVEKKIRLDIKKSLIEELELIEPLLDDKYITMALGSYISDILGVKNIIKKCIICIQQDKSINGNIILDSMQDPFNDNNIKDSISIRIWKIEMGIKLLKEEDLFKWIKQYNIFFEDGVTNKNELLAKFILLLCYEEKLKNYLVDENQLFSDYWIKKLSKQMPDFVESNTVYSCNMKIYDNLTAAGKWAYKSAIWQYEQVAENGYELMDAGLLSLAFMRVLEVEMNERFINPLKKYFSKGENKNIRESIPADLFGFKELRNADNQGLMLGQIRAIFVGARTETENIGKIVSEIYKSDILTDVGFSALKTGELEKIISDEKVKMYRNPPAHARYLQKKSAYDAKNEVENCLKIICNYYQ